MPFYELTFEPGTSSVAFYDSEDEMKAAVAAHHQRALKGEPGGPIGQPAERVVAVRQYDEHPNDYNLADTLSADVAKSEVDALIKAGAASNDGVIPMGQLAVEVRRLTDPMVVAKENAFDSNFKMKEKANLKLDFLEG